MPSPWYLRNGLSETKKPKLFGFGMTRYDLVYNEFLWSELEDMDVDDVYLQQLWRNHRSFAWKVSRPSNFSKWRLQLAAEIMQFNTSRLFYLGLRERQVYADVPQSIQELKEKIRAVIDEIEPKMCENVMK